MNLNYENAGMDECMHIRAVADGAKDHVLGEVGIRGHVGTMNTIVVIPGRRKPFWKKQPYPEYGQENEHLIGGITHVGILWLMKHMPDLWAKLFLGVEAAK